MKSHLNLVVSVYEGIITDISTHYTNHRESLWTDLVYLRRAAEQRGLGFFTLTLPALGKALDKCLDEGSILACEVPQGVPRNKVGPILFGSLLEMVFSEDGMLRPQPDISAIYYLRQLCFVAKKLRLDCSDRAMKETLDEFFKIESDLPNHHEDTWDSNIPKWKERVGHPLWGIHSNPYDAQGDFLDRPNRASGIAWDRFRLLCRRVVSNIYPPDWWSLRPKHGPGAVSDKCDSGTKYNFPHWPEKLDLWFPYDWYGSGRFDPDQDIPSDWEPPSRLIAVPKTQKGPRLICAEPIAHMWMQQALRMYLEAEVRKSSLGLMIDFRDQERSRKLALDASLNGEYATIDLSSASDRLSTRLVEYVFQGHPLLDGLHATRSRHVRQQISDKHDSHIKLRKFAPQGSALTFPVQSIVYALIALFGYRESINRGNDYSTLLEDMRKVRVFGDDIIVPKCSYENVVNVLQDCGLKVNTSKSFSKGFFRESCGMDAYGGEDVTPAYILEPYTTSPTSMAATIDCSNNFMLKGMFWTARVIASQIPECERKLIPVIGDDDGNLGLFSFCGSDYSHLKMKWNRDYQIEEYLVLGLLSRQGRTRGTGYGDLSQFFWEEPANLLDWQAGQVTDVRVRKQRTWARCESNGRDPHF